MAENMHYLAVLLSSCYTGYMIIDVSGHLRNERREDGFKDHSKDLIVNCAGYQKFHEIEFTRLRPKGRKDFQILYIARGEGKFLLQGLWRVVKEGEMILYVPGEIQHYRYLPDTITEVCWVHFTGFKALLYLQEYNLDAPAVQHIGTAGNNQVLFMEIMTELQTKAYGFEKMVRAKFFQLISHLERQVAEQGGKKNRLHPSIAIAVEFIHRHYNEQLDLNQLADLCHLSKHRFCHVFSEAMGMAPISYAIHLRMETAKELLQTSSFNISQVSVFVGYDNPFYFSRIFAKKSGGVSPRAWRQEKAEA